MMLEESCIMLRKYEVGLWRMLLLLGLVFHILNKCE
jgi:hypothetical protein